MSISSELCATLRERFEDRPPRQYMSLPYDFRAELGGGGIKLYNIHHGEQRAEIGETGRDASGFKWFLRPGWRELVKGLVIELGMEVQTVEEEISW